MATKDFKGFKTEEDTYNCYDDGGRTLIGGLDSRVGIAESRITNLQSNKADKSVVDDILDGQSIESFSDVEAALEDKANTTALTAAINGQEQLLEDTVGWSGKNLFEIKGSNTSSQGITYTVDKANGTVTANASTSSSARGGIELLNQNNGQDFASKYAGKEVILTGGKSAKRWVQFWSTVTQSILDIGSGAKFTLPSNLASISWNITLLIDAGEQPSNEVFYPMVRLSNVVDESFEPYHASVEETLTTKTDNSVIAPVENGTNASQAYAVGSHAIRNGAFITWKNAKAQGETINDANDYTSGDIADILNNFNDLSASDISDLNNVESGMGRRRFLSSVSPVGGDVAMPYLALKNYYIIAFRVSTGEAFYTCKYQDSWSAWKQISIVS